MERKSPIKPHRGLGTSKPSGAFPVSVTSYYPPASFSNGAYINFLVYFSSAKNSPTSQNMMAACSRLSSQKISRIPAELFRLLTSVDILIPADTCWQFDTCWHLSAVWYLLIFWYLLSPVVSLISADTYWQCETCWHLLQCDICWHLLTPVGSLALPDTCCSVIHAVICYQFIICWHHLAVWYLLTPVASWTPADTCWYLDTCWYVLQSDTCCHLLAPVWYLLTFDGSLIPADIFVNILLVHWLFSKVCFSLRASLCPSLTCQIDDF